MADVTKNMAAGGENKKTIVEKVLDVDRRKHIT